MCPSSGHWEEFYIRLRRRVIRSWHSRDLQPVALLGLPALIILLVLYWFPVFSILGLCGAAAVWYYHSSGRTLWRLPIYWRQLTGGAVRRRQREAVVRWASPSSSVLLMGSYLSTQEPPGQGLARGRDFKERLMRPNPTVPTPTRRLSFRDTPVVANQGVLSPRRRYPIKQIQFSRPGSLPTGCFDGYQNKLLLSPKRSRATVKFPRLDTSFARSPILENLLSPGSTSPPVEHTPDPCAKETVLDAIKECMKRKQMNKEEYSTSGGLENKRRRLESCGSAESSSEYFLPNGTLPSYISESGSLKRGLNSNVLEDHMNKRPCTSSVSSRSSSSINGIKRPTHDAITSSYSSIVSTHKRKRNLQNVSAGSSSPSSRNQTPDLSAKKSRDSQETGQSTPVPSEKDPSGRSNGSPSSAANSSPEKGKSFPRREKLLLLIAGREPYKLPPPPIPGYNVTQKDYDAERKASLLRLCEAMGDKAAPVQSPNTSPLNEKLSVSSALTLPEPANTVIGSLTKSSFLTSSLPAPVVTEVSINAPPPPSDNPQPKSEPPQTSLLQILTKPLENVSQSGFKPILPTVSPVSSSGGVTTATAPTTDTFKPIFGDGSLPVQSSSTFKPIFGSSTAQQPTSAFTFQMSSTTSAATSLPGFRAVTTSTPVSAIIAPKPSLAPPISSTSSTTNTLASLFPSAAAATATSGTSSAPVNSLLVNSAPADSQGKQFVFGQTTTSQATPGLNVFSSIQPASVSAPQQSAPVAPQQSSVFAFNTSAFTAPVSSNSSAPVANSGTTTSGSSNIQPAFGGFGTSSQPTFGANSQPQFGLNSTFNTGNSTFVASKEAFGTMNSAQTNSNPVTNLFASKPIASVGNSSSAPSFGTINTPAPSLSFGNTLGQNSVVQNPSTPLAFGTSENELSFASQFGQSSPAASLSFSTPSPASTGSPFAPGNFKIGVTSTKPLGARQRVLARRQRKK